MADEDFWTNVLSPRVARLLESAMESGLGLPWHFAVIGANGALIYRRYDPAADGTLTATNLLEHRPDEKGLQAPINLLIVGSNGKIVRDVIPPFPRN